MLFLFILIFFFSCSIHNVHNTQAPAVNHTIKNKWWYIFNDANLNNFINIALKKNLDLKLAEQDIEIARYNYFISKSSLFPFINLSGSGVRYKRYLRGKSS